MLTPDKLRTGQITVKNNAAVTLYLRFNTLFLLYLRANKRKHAVPNNMPHFRVVCPRAGVGLNYPWTQARLFLAITR